MRSKAAALVAALAADELDLVVLVEISRAAGTLRYALDALPRTWNGETWLPTAGALDEVQESAEREIPSLRLVLQNVDGVLGPLVYPDAGGEDLRGRRVTIRQASRAHLEGENPDDLVIDYTFVISDYQIVGRGGVAFELGVFPAAELRVPDRTLQGIRCRWCYRGRHCGYVGDLPDCARTAAACREHFPDDDLPFGGFPTSADARALRVE